GKRETMLGAMVRSTQLRPEDHNGTCGEGPRLIWLVLAWVLGTAVVTVGGCTLSRSGTMANTCSTDEQCEDNNPCTTTRCLESGICEATPFDEGTAALVQQPFDCKRTVCQGGVQIEEADD